MIFFGFPSPAEAGFAEAGNRRPFFAIMLWRRMETENAGADVTPAPSSSRQSNRLQIGRGGLAAAPVGFDVESQLLPLIEVRHAGALDGGDVNEHIRAARVLHDEAETLLGVEKLDGTLSHDGLHLKRLMRFVAERTIRAAFNPDFACSWERPSLGEHDFFGKSVCHPDSGAGFFRIMLCGRDGKAG
jgi:hypothetical protein